MKTKFWIVAALGLASGCAQGRHAVITRQSGPIFPATQNVKVMHFQPSQPFTELATLEVDDRSHDVEGELAKKAAEIGADAVIITGQRAGRHVSAPVGGVMVGRNLTRTQAIAIKFKAVGK